MVIYAIYMYLIDNFCFKMVFFRWLKHFNLIRNKMEDNWKIMDILFIDLNLSLYACIWQTDKSFKHIPVK